MRDNKLFWETVKPFFSNKGERGSNIQLVKDDDKEIADELNAFFKKCSFKNLNINENTYIINHDTGHLSDSDDKAISKYKFHPSILLIRKIRSYKVISMKKFGLKLGMK